MFVTLVMESLMRQLLLPLQSTVYTLHTFSTTEYFHAFYLLCSFTVSQVGPVAPPPIFDLLADSQVPLLVVGYQLVAQSLASVGLLDSPDTELGFLVY